MQRYGSWPWGSWRPARSGVPFPREFQGPVGRSSRVLPPRCLALQLAVWTRQRALLVHTAVAAFSPSSLSVKALWETLVACINVCGATLSSAIAEQVYGFLRHLYRNSVCQHAAPRLNKVSQNNRSLALVACCKCQAGETRLGAWSH